MIEAVLETYGLPKILLEVLARPAETISMSLTDKAKIKKEANQWVQLNALSSP